jgi:alpha-1,3-rhamnosyltransferase
MNMEENQQDCPLVSVVVPCYNHEKFVQECIQSVLEQDYKNLELIIIDDGSKDCSVEKIQRMIPECIKRFIRFEFKDRENKGLAVSLNESLKWAQGKYFTVIASDDLMAVNKVSALVHKLENVGNDFAVAFGDASFIDEKGEPLFFDIKLNDKKCSTNSFCEFYKARRKFDYENVPFFGSYSSLIAGNYLPAMSYVVRTELLRSVGAWMEGNRVEDWDVWLKLAKKYKFYFINTSVACYRLHDANSIYANSVKLTLDSIKLLKRERNYAISHGYSQQYFDGLALQDLSLMRLRSKFFIKSFLGNIFSVSYCKSFLKNIYLRILKWK